MFGSFYHNTKLTDLTQTDAHTRVPLYYQNEKWVTPQYIYRDVQNWWAKQNLVTFF